MAFGGETIDKLRRHPLVSGVVDANRSARQCLGLAADRE